MSPFNPRCLLPILDTFPDARRCWIAYSGGLDSQVLLHAAASLRGRVSATLQAVHVDHGLHPDSARWADHCRGRCAELDVPLSVRRLALEPGRGESLEAMAREARYGLLRELVEAGDLLLTAHHRDDQAETLLLALMRGSGVQGLAAMPGCARFGNAWLVRPLLEYAREDLLDYARRERLVWLDDPSNGDQSFDRNYLRARVLPLLAARWPSCAATVARTASHCAEAQEIIDRVAERKLGLAKGSRPGTLSVKRLLELEFPLVKAVLRHWLREQEFPTPDSRRLERVVLDMLRAGEDRSPLVRWSGCEVRRYRDDLFAMAPMPDPPEDLTLFWMRGTLQLPPGLGRLRVSGDAVGDLDPSALFPAGLKVSFGCEGLRCRPASRARHRKLKQLFQEAGVPPWLRPYVPYLFSGGQLIAVGDLWRCVEARPGAQPLWRISWEGGVRDHSGFSP